MSTVVQVRCSSSSCKAQDLGTWLPVLCRQMGSESVQELPFWRVVPMLLAASPSLWHTAGYLHKVSSIKESQNHRIVGVGRDLCGSSSPTLLPKQGHLQETPQPPWAACSSAPSPSEGRNSSSCSDGTSCASVCAHCPLSCHQAPLKRVWPHPPDTHPSDICKYRLTFKNLYTDFSTFLLVSSFIKRYESNDG